MKNNSLVIIKVATLVCGIFFILWYTSNYINFGDNDFGVNFVRKNPDYLEKNKTLNFVITIIFTPFLEELFYRKGLKYSVTNSLLLLTGIFYTLFLLFISNLNINNPINHFSFLLGLCFVFILGIFANKYKEKIKLVYSKYPKYIITVSIVSFAYSHYPMYSNNINVINILLSPLLLLQYFLGGAFFSVINLKYGFWFGVFAHVLWNYLVTFQ